ncbi:hypothetical protein EDB85DRAFT_2276398 [Lactarius pseudohatsudake]|nr:hypothetical protein EDB85DRAFT_2276398 [Lactarius pseudohatsudake]
MDLSLVDIIGLSGLIVSLMDSNSLARREGAIVMGTETVTWTASSTSTLDWFFNRLGDSLSFVVNGPCNDLHRFLDWLRGNDANDSCEVEWVLEGKEREKLEEWSVKPPIVTSIVGIVEYSINIVHRVLQKIELEMARAHGESNRHAVTINILPDDILLEIFAFCLPDPHASLDSIRRMRVWQRLNLGLWPDFPLTVVFDDPKDQDDFIAALEHPGRVRRIDIFSICPDVFEVVEAMRVPFPALTHLELTGPEHNDHDPDVLDLPDEFLGGSAPCLQHICLENISFPGLPTLLLSARDLVSLQLESVPPTYSDYGHISPEEMVSSLAVLTKLRTLSIYRYPSEDSEPSPIPSDEQRRRPDPPMLAVLPALTQFVFGRDFEYLEDLVAQIDAPRVEDVSIEYSMNEVQTRQLSQFVGRSNLKRAEFRRAQVTFYLDSVYIKFDLPQGECLHAKFLIKTILDDAPIVSPVLYVVHVLGQLVAMTSSVGHLRVSSRDFTIPRQVGQDLLKSELLPLLRLFFAVEVLEVSGGLAGCIASALEDTAEETLLPALQLLWLEDNNCNKPERFCHMGGCFTNMNMAIFSAFIAWFIVSILCTVDWWRAAALNIIATPTVPLLMVDL